ncbi:MAG: hypothetical protein ABFD13_07320 [Candidatus Cryosericum sp.]
MTVDYPHDHEVEDDKAFLVVQQGDDVGIQCKEPGVGPPTL